MDTLLSSFSRSVRLQRADSTAQIGMHSAQPDTALDALTPGLLPLHWSARCHSHGFPLLLLLRLPSHPIHPSMIKFPSPSPCIPSADHP